MSFPLQQLKDIHLGPPPAEGWLATYGVLLITLLLGALLIGLAYRLWPLVRAYHQLHHLPRQPHDFMPSLNLWLKSTALLLWPRHEVASLHGVAWLTFLDCSSRSHFLQYAKHWDDWTYGTAQLSKHERQALFVESQRWLRGQIRRRLCSR